MHIQIEAQQRISSFGCEVQHGILSFKDRVARFLRTAKDFHVSVRIVRAVIPPASMLMGAVAFGFWWKSIAAGLFACSAMFLLAGLYKTMPRAVAPGSMEAGNLKSELSTMDEAAYRNISAAIEHLQPWVADEVSLTEEDAKARCAVLLDALHVRFSGIESHDEAYFNFGHLQH